MEALAEAYSYELAGQGIESVIVEPGAYETAVFGNTVRAADEARTVTYGAVKEMPAKVSTALASGPEMLRKWRMRCCGLSRLRRERNS